MRINQCNNGPVAPGQKLSSHLAAVLGWMRDNRPRLNLDKIGVPWVGAPGVCGLIGSLSFGGVTLSSKDEVHRLSILLDPVLCQ